ncbi:Asp23/Gls24 family envelope stress response protein [Pseudonocardia nigra]|uniref:Asp23/Gls24 family envelope stress response protein n=1 Tax=Pseudonocardia nigra TaxID=1921578 RepID=UPI0027E36E15|nr:Asp23/Gls24 family envelope stress response protein [Pseudonocardia nigra]
MAVTPDPAEPGAAAPVDPLACGRDAALVWDRAEAGAPPDEHERDCPHCRAAFADARGLDSVVHRMAAEEVEPPASVLDRVMTAVVTEFRPHDVLTLHSPHGPARLSRPAAAAVLRHVVDRMGGLRARSCRIEQLADAAGQPPAATVSMTVTARFGVDLASVTARVRQMVIAAGEQALGVPVRRVDIDVVDVFGEP